VLFLPFQVSFKSNCRDFIANNEWPPIYPPSIHWIIRFGGNAGVTLITSCNWNQNQFPSLKMLLSWFGVPYRRKPLRTPWKTTTSI